MLTKDAVVLLESGCGLVVGLVAPDGAPFASRGWGLKLDDDRRRGRLLVSERDIAAVGRQAGTVIGANIAVTGASVLTLRSVQLKGPLTGIEPPSDTDRALLARYCDAFFDDVTVIDGIARHLLERLVPSAVVACVFEIHEIYDQTPGPNAGAAVQTGSP